MYTPLVTWLYLHICQSSAWMPLPPEALLKAPPIHPGFGHYGNASAPGWLFGYPTAPHSSRQGSILPVSVCPCAGAEQKLDAILWVHELTPGRNFKGPWSGLCVGRGGRGRGAFPVLLLLGQVSVSSPRVGRGRSSRGPASWVVENALPPPRGITPSDSSACWWGDDFMVKKQGLPGKGVRQARLWELGAHPQKRERSAPLTWCAVEAGGAQKREGLAWAEDRQWRPQAGKHWGAQTPASRRSQHFRGADHVPSTVPSALQMLIHLILTTTPWGRDYYHPHVTSEETRHREGMCLTRGSTQAAVLCFGWPLLSSSREGGESGQS